MPENAPVQPVPAATVILLRDAPGGIETLLLRRNSQLAFHGGSWVFPGGRVDPEDFDPAIPDDVDAAAAAAAVREAKEEAGLDVPIDQLIYFSHWTTPVGLPKRFSTWFYLAPAQDADVEIDGGEIHDHAWHSPASALEAQGAGEIELPAPTFVSLLGLAEFSTVEETMRAHAERPAEIYVPRNQKVPGGRLSLYHGDAGYDTETADADGARHRLWMVESGWRYERAG